MQHPPPANADPDTGGPALTDEARLQEKAEEARLQHLQTGERLASRLGVVFRYVGAALLISIAIRTFLVQPFAIPSGSMSPLLEAGDFVLVDKAAYGWTLASLPLAGALSTDDNGDARRLFAKPVNAGDVIVFVSPGGQDYVKRMVASGGDRVAMRGGALILNGRMVDCVALGGGLCRETLPGGASHVVRSDGSGPLSDMGEITVPAGHYFVLGDNRDDSADSRLSRAEGGVGLVPDINVIGRASRIFFSAHEGIRWSRIGQAID